MYLPQPLIQGKLLKRYKRFLCDVLLENNQVITAHCPNSGSMLNIINPESTVYLSYISNKKAKLQYRLELVSNNNNLIGVNCLRTNNIIFEAIKNGIIPEFNKYKYIKKEAAFGNNCRFDFILSTDLPHNNSEICYIEAKNVTLKRTNNVAEFPDAITLRGQKHIDMLLQAKIQRANTYLIFLIQREDCNVFSVAKDIDVQYYQKIKTAISNGINILCYNCHVTLTHITLNKPIKFLI